MGGVSLPKLPHAPIMRRGSYNFSKWVILNGAKDLAQASLITLEKQRDANSVGEVPHFVRDDTCSTRDRMLFATLL
jgi:hypothetical protein